ncbi:MAG: RidA family protein [Aeromicrobium sp.]
MIEFISQQTAKGPYSTIVAAGDVVYLSGQGGIDPVTGHKVVGGITPETRQTIENIESLLASIGLHLSSLVTVTCYLADIDEWDEMNQAYAAAMGPDARPVRTAVEVSALPFGLAIEMTATAYRG